MNRILIALLALVASALTTLAHAQPLMWQKITPNSAYGKIARDTSGNLYQVTRTSSFVGRELNVTKYNPAGSPQWTRTFKGSGNLDVQFRIVDVALSATHLYVVFEEAAGGGYGSTQSARIANFSKADGSTTIDLTAAAYDFAAVGCGTNQVALLRRNTTTGIAEVLYINEVSWATVGTTTLGNVTGIGDLAMDSSNNVYAVCNDGGEVQLTKCNSTSGIAYQTVYSTTNYNSESPKRIAIDTAGNRAYVLGYGTWHLSPFDVDALLWVANLSTGAQILITTALGSSLDDFEGSLLVIPSGGVITSAYTYDNSTTDFRRFSTNGAVTWTRQIPNSPSGYGRDQAFDVDGNVLGLTPTPTNDIRLSRINVSSGALIDEFTFPVATFDTPLNILTDSAGVAYVNFHDNSGASLARVQKADMAFTSNLVTGGYATSLQITAAVAPTADQTWTLSSGNTAVATVAASATITAGNFSITTPVNTLPVAANTNVSINARNGGLILQKTLTVLASQLESIGATPNSLIGGNTFAMTLTLTGQAPTGGRVITLSSNKPAVIALPANYTIPAGVAGVGITTNTFAVNTNQGVVLSATLGAVTKTVFMAVNAPSLTAITIAPSTVQGGTNSTLILVINGKAPTGGFSITLISGAPGIVLLPGTASVAAGLTSRSLNFATSAVTSTVNVTLFATRAGIYRTATLTVVP